MSESSKEGDMGMGENKDEIMPSIWEQEPLTDILKKLIK